VIIAFWLESWLTKDEILSRYLSSVYFGDGVYGLRAAARHYFKRDPEKLTLAQSAMLAGMVQAPSRLAPTRNLAAAQKRSRLVLQEMADTGVISLARARAAASARPVVSTVKVPTGTFFADWVAPQAADAFASDFGEIKVRTTLDSRLQRLASRAVANASIDGAQAAMVAMRPDGRVVAMVGGTSYKASPFNRATQARRQPGSAFKLFVYLAAMRSGWTPESKISDTAITIDGWKPANSDGVYRGEVSLKEAFARSSNAATVRLSEAVGRQNVLRAARDLGISTPLPNTPSVALGTAGVSLLELTGAYAAVASGRYPIRATGLPPRLAREGEEDKNLSSLFFTQGGRLNRSREWKPMLDLLWAAANEGTGRRAALSTPTFGKTGTSQDNRDALFVGFAGDLVVGVWVGRDDNRPMSRAMSGGTAPAEVWRAFMTSALSIDGRSSVSLPQDYQPPRRLPSPDRQSPLPADWDPDPSGWMSDLVKDAERLLDRL
jgi:penicillin-binding protein 1A